MIITSNLCRLLGFDDAILSSYTKEEIGNREPHELISSCDKFIYLNKTNYISRKIQSFCSNGDDVLRFLLYDKIEQCSYRKDGTKHPVLFDYDMTSNSKSYLSGKVLTVPDLKQFRFGLFRRCDMLPFMVDHDFKIDPFCVTLLIYYSYNYNEWCIASRSFGRSCSTIRESECHS